MLGFCRFNLQRDSIGIIQRSCHSVISLEDNIKDIAFANKDDEYRESLKHVQTIDEVPMVLQDGFITNESRNDVKDPYESRDNEEFEDKQKSIHSRMVKINKHVAKRF